MDWILALALGTFALLLAFLWWNRTSTVRNHRTGHATRGLGGPHDPLGGAAEGMRNPDSLRSNLDEAAARGGPARPVSNRSGN